MTPLDQERKSHQPIVYVFAGSDAEFERFLSDYPWVRAFRVVGPNNLVPTSGFLFALIGAWACAPRSVELEAEMRARGSEWKPTQHAMSCNVMRFRNAAHLEPRYSRGSHTDRRLANSRILCSCGWKP